MSINNRSLRSNRGAAAASSGASSPSSSSASLASSLESRINTTSQKALDKINSTLDNLKTNTLPRAETKIKEKLHDMPAVLTNTQLRNLDDHKYSASGNTLLDPFRHAADRKLERRLLADYEETVALITADLRPDNYDAAIALADYPATIRGYGPVKAESAIKATALATEREEAFRTGVPQLAEAAE